MESIVEDRLMIVVFTNEMKWGQKVAFFLSLNGFVLLANGPGQQTSEDDAHELWTNG